MMAKTMKIVTMKERSNHTIKIQVNPLKGRKFTTSEIGRGIGGHKVKKGKGSYTRKIKHKSKIEWE